MIDHWLHIWTLTIAERKEKKHTTDSHLLAFCNRNLLPPVILKKQTKKKTLSHNDEQ